MAEEVSGTVSQLQTKMNNLRTMAVVSAIGLYGGLGVAYYIYRASKNWVEFPFPFPYTLAAIAVSLAIGCMYILIQYISKIKSYRYEVDSEKKILHRLLDMVYEYKGHIEEDELSIVDSALLDMKLQRIKFSGKW